MFDISIELGLLFAAIACIIGVAGFISGRQTSAKQAGAETATFRSDILYLKDAVADIKRMLERGDEERRSDLSELRREFKDSVARIEANATRAHTRLDEHIKAGAT